MSEAAAPILLHYVNLWNFANAFDFSTVGDLGLEGLGFIDADNCPHGKPLLVVGHEVSGITAIFTSRLR